MMVIKVYRQRNYTAYKDANYGISLLALTFGANGSIFVLAQDISAVKSAV